MIERAGVDMDALNAVAPGALHGFGEEPPAVPLAGQLGHEADKGELAFSLLTKVELEHSTVAAVLVLDGVKLDVGMAYDNFEIGIAEDQSRKPEPRRPDEA